MVMPNSSTATPACARLMPQLARGRLLRRRKKPAGFLKSWVRSAISISTDARSQVASVRPNAVITVPPTDDQKK